MVKKEIKKAKNSFWERKCEEINSLLGSSRSRLAWKTLGSLKTNTQQQIKVDPIGHQKWRDHYQELLTENRPLYSQIQYTSMPIALGEGCEEVTCAEILIALKSTKNNRSPGPGSIPIELIKNAPIVTIESLAGIFTECIRGGEVPGEWKLSYISSIYKKGDRKNCGNYRGISVLSSIGRLYGRILTKRLEQQTSITEEQSGFRSGRSCVDNLFCIKQLMDKSIAHGSELHLIFVDLKKAFDSVPLNKLWEALEDQGIQSVYINAIKKLYENAESCVRSGNSYSEEFKITKGVRQGCPLSPTLFKIYVNRVLENWSRKCSSMGVKMGEEHIHSLLFADDQVVLAEDEHDAEYMMRKLIEEYDSWGLEVNMEKTQYMVIGREGQDMVTDKGIIKSTNEYKYLGVTLTADGSDEKDVLSKLGRGRAITRQLHPVLWNDVISSKTKMHIYKSFVESCASYGSEIWTLSSRLAQRVRAMEMGYWRRCGRVTLLDHVRNDRIREMMGVETSLTDNIEMKQLLWYGHLRRMPDGRLPMKAWSWVPPRRRKRGRPKKTWAEGISTAMSRRGLQDEDFLNKEIWHLGCRIRPA